MSSKTRNRWSDGQYAFSAFLAPGDGNAVYVPRRFAQPFKNAMIASIKASYGASRTADHGVIALMETSYLKTAIDNLLDRTLDEIEQNPGEFFRNCGDDLWLRDPESARRCHEAFSESMEYCNIRSSFPREFAFRLQPRNVRSALISLGYVRLEPAVRIKLTPYMTED